MLQICFPISVMIAVRAKKAVKVLIKGSTLMQLQ